MRKYFATESSNSTRHPFDFREFAELLTKEKPKEIWHSRWEDEQQPFIIITEYTDWGLRYYCTAWNVPAPEHITVEKLHRFLSIQGLRDCYINVEELKMQENGTT